MKQFLAGAAAATAVVLAALAGWALLGPQAPPPATPDHTTLPAAERIAQHGRALQRQVQGMQYVGTEETLARPRKGYRVTFTAAGPAPESSASAAGSPATDAAPEAVAAKARQAAWQQRFCTDALRADMAAQGVAVVTGRVIDGGGSTQYVANCVAGGAAQLTGPGGPLL